MDVSVIKLLFLLLASSSASAQRPNSKDAFNITTLLDSFQQGYDARVRPNYFGQGVVVGVSAYILSIPSLSEANMDFTMDMYFRQFWTDPRLSFEARPDLKKVVLVGADHAEKLWRPDTFFVNEKSSMLHTATVSNEFVRILHTGEVLRSIRLSVTASCPMDLQYFPMDSQLCNLEIESYGFTMADIAYKWNDGLSSIQISPDASLPEFRVVGHRQKTIQASLSTGNYSRLAVEFLFKRSSGHYILQVYIPCSMLVIMSWVTFWLDRKVLSARVGLTTAALLALTFMASSAIAARPKVSYLTAMDMFLGTCIFMAFAALLEVATVVYVGKDGAMGMWSRKKVDQNDAEAGGQQGFRLKAADVDRISRMVFPAVFVVFQMAYWIGYRSVTNVEVEDLVYLQ